jgi:hypothetical protein
MEEASDRLHNAADAVCEAFNQIGDFSYAIMPKDLAHAVGDLKKAVLTNLRSAIDWEIDWITERVAGGDRLRDEWREKCRRTENQTASTESA